MATWSPEGKNTLLLQCGDFLWVQFSGPLDVSCLLYRDAKSHVGVIYRWSWTLEEFFPNTMQSESSIISVLTHASEPASQLGRGALGSNGTYSSAGRISYEQ